MDIQFRCSNPYQFKEGGNHQKCAQLLQVSSENIGLDVRCPRCNQMVTVPSQARRVPSDGGDANLGSSESVAQVQADLTYGKFSQRTRCPKCGGLLDDRKKCTACGYETPLVQASQIPINELKAKPAGFQLWFQGIMADSIGMQFFQIGANFFVLIIVSALVTLAVLLGAPAAMYLTLAAVALALGYLLIVIQAKRLAKVPGTRLPFYVKPLWNGLLNMARKQNWQKYDSSLAGRLIIDVRGQTFGDRDLLDLDNLNLCQVLDAEGTDLTDNALAAMYGLKNLRCLVLKGTHVNPEAVFRLQQSLPRCWIWY